MCFRISATEGLNPTHSRLTPARHFRWDRSLCCPALTPGLDSLFPAHICAGTDWAHPLSAVSAGTGWAHPRPPSALGQDSSSPTSVPGPDRFLPTTARRINRRCALLRREWTHPIPHLRRTKGHLQQDSLGCPRAPDLRHVWADPHPQRDWLGSPRAQLRRDWLGSPRIRRLRRGWLVLSHICAKT